MKRILLPVLFLSFVGTAFLGTGGITKASSETRISGVRSFFVRAQSGNGGTESHDRRWSRCGEVPPGRPGDRISPELESTNVGAMLGRAGEEEILKPSTICENYRPAHRS